MKPDNNEDKINKKHEPESDEEEDERPRKKRKYNLRKRPTTVVKFVEEESSEEEEQQFYSYMEQDFDRMQTSISKYVIDQFGTQEQNLQFRGKVRRGVKRAFDMMSNAQKDSIDEFGDPRPTSSMWKLGCGPREIQKYQKQLQTLRNEIYKSERLGIVDILKANLTKNDNKTALQLFDMLQNMDTFTPEYILLKKQLIAILDTAKKSGCTPEQLEELVKREEQLKQVNNLNRPLKLRILEADLDSRYKAHIYDRYLQMERTRDDSVTAANLREWIENALKVPFNTASPPAPESPADILVQIKQGLDARLFGMGEVKERILCIFNNRFNSPTAKGTIISLIGNPGTGKTELSRSLAEILGIPFEQISLGGMVDSSLLDGQHQGWVGSTPGRIIKALQKMGSGYGIIFFDEIDKLGESPHGREVQETLLYILDFVQNADFHDHYLGHEMPVDLSKIIFVTAMNKTDGLDAALVSRLSQMMIRIPDYTSIQKVHIVQDYILPRLLQDIDLEPGDITMSKATIEYAIEKLKLAHGVEGGVRGLKGCLTVIVNKLNVLLKVPFEQQQAMGLSFALPNLTKPIVLTNAMVDRLYKPETEGNGPPQAWYL